MATNLKQRHIACFLAIVRERSLSAASDSLAMTPPAVSRTLSDLERIVRARLMERSRQGVSLTESGEIFLRYASASEAALDEAVTQIGRNRATARQALNVGAMPNTLAQLLPRSVKQFKTANSDVLVRVVTGTNRELTQQLREGDLDFLVGRLAASEHMYGLQFEPLFTEELLPIVRPDHPLLDIDDPATLAERLHEYTVVLPMKGTVVRPDAEQLLNAAGCREMGDVIESLSMDFARNYVLETSAIWITPRGTVEADIRAGRVGVLPLDASSARGTTGITSRQGLALSPYALALVRHIRAEAKNDGRTPLAGDLTERSRPDNAAKSQMASG